MSKNVDKITFLKEQIELLSISMETEQYEQFWKYYTILTEWNKVMNLTAISDYEEVVMKHFVDSLALVKVMELDKHMNVLDMGTGAGFPGIPLKIAFPKLSITLLDSLNKRIKFLNEVISRLELKDIQAYHGRAEEYGRNKDFRGQYEICVSRAVANLATLSEYCIPYVKQDGYFVSYKSGEIEEELEQSKKAISMLGGKIEKVEKFCLPGTDMERSMVVIRKVKETPKAYPRNAGKPSKEPLGMKNKK